MIEYPGFDPIALQLGPLAIRWYGLMYLASFVLAWFLYQRHARRQGLGWSEDDVSDLLFYGALGVIVGGRIGSALFYNFDLMLADPLWVFRLWEPGMSFHGGLLGVLVATLYFARRKGVGFWVVVDFVAPVVPVGLGLGRIGNFINGELWGKPAITPFSMVVDGVARHPSQLYEFALEGVVMFAVLWWFAGSKRPVMAVSGLFGLLYGSFRFLVEFVREPDAHLGYLYGDWLTMGQLLSLPMILVGAALLVLAYRNPMTKTA
jgi:phosphatidylglycerol:prolipoprotein diacylglycerol transferase